MKVILGIITILLLLSVSICGLWISSNQITDSSALNFHLRLGVVSVIFGIVSASLLVKSAF